MRTCAKCKCDDYPVVEGFEEMVDKKTLRRSLQPVTRHFVRPDMYFLDKVRPLTDQEKRLNFEFRMADGKPAKYRFICDKCLSDQEWNKQWHDAFEKEKAKQSDDASLKNSLFVQEFCLNTE